MSQGGESNRSGKFLEQAIEREFSSRGVHVANYGLDPFAGSGTTGLVADRNGRNAILIELNPEYVEMARKRIDGDAPLLTAMAEPTMFDTLKGDLPNG